mgnify:CR=1 FL=1
MQVWGGVDFGGTNIKLGLVTRQGRLIARTTLATRQHADPDAFARGVACVLQSLSRARGAHVLGVGVGAPGLIDTTRGRIHQLTNVPGGWRGARLGALLERRVRCRCVIDNDVNVIALGEWSFGAGRGTRHSVYLTLGTGVGGGLVLNGRLVRGAIGSAGEVGHMAIAPSGPRCACGRRGCLEAFIGTAAVLRRARRAMHRNAPRLRSLAERAGSLTPEVVARAAWAGDRAARGIWREVGDALGRGLANVVNLLNPERIVIGGGVGKAWGLFAPTMRASLRAHAFEAPAKAVSVVRAQLGDRAGIIGAAVLAWERVGGGA